MDFHFHGLILQTHRYGGCTMHVMQITRGQLSNLCAGVHVCVSKISGNCQCLYDLGIWTYDLGILTTFTLKKIAIKQN